ncbi:MAG: hypothetical protein JNL38_18290 [Myxococcales bacterium]|jgi:hypothetical protein|nr:hypothetical protein [Myxococcales bacterium]
MKLLKVLSVLGVCSAVALTLAAQQGCSSDDTSSGGTAGAGAVPPEKPNAPATDSKDVRVFAVQNLLFGDTDRTSGAASGEAWKKYGYNLDGKLSTSKSTDICTPAEGGSKDAAVDGADGRDNSFGKNIVPIIQQLAGNDFGKSVNDSVQGGSFTVMFEVTGLKGEKQTNTGLSGQIFAGAKFDGIPENQGKKPTFTKADNWPVSGELLNGDTIESGSKVKITDAYIVNGTFVAKADKITISLVLQGQALNISINKAIITMDVAGENAGNGTIAGVIDANELITGLKSVAGSISKSLCEGTTFDNIAQQLRQFSDILSDGSNAAGQKCTGISVGLGFTGKEIGRPTKVTKSSGTGGDPCKEQPDAGKDSGSSGGQDSGSSGGQDSGTD